MKKLVEDIRETEPKLSEKAREEAGQAKPLGELGDLKPATLKQVLVRTSRRKNLAASNYFAT